MTRLPAPPGETSSAIANGGGGRDASTGVAASHTATVAASAAIVGRHLGAVGDTLGVIGILLRMLFVEDRRRARRLCRHRPRERARDDRGKRAQRQAEANRRRSVAELDVDPWGLAVSPANFSDQLAWLRTHRTIMSLAEFVARLERGDLPLNAVALTFDDGYADNLLNALPALAKQGASATLFLATGQHANL